MSWGAAGDLVAVGGVTAHLGQLEGAEGTRGLANRAGSGFFPEMQHCGVLAVTVCPALCRA